MIGRLAARLESGRVLVATLEDDLRWSCERTGDASAMNAIFPADDRPWRGQAGHEAFAKAVRMLGATVTMRPTPPPPRSAAIH